jgi:hypothetical protein
MDDKEKMEDKSKIAKKAPVKTEAKKSDAVAKKSTSKN